jgi:circadian clock protein KaiB
MMAVGTPDRPLVLFVTGDAPRSRRARDNLARGLEAVGCGRDIVDEIDLIHSPSRAIEAGIFATPALLRAGADEQPAVLYGDLSDEARLQRFLADLARGEETG